MKMTDLNGMALGTTITSAQLAAGIVLDGVKVEIDNPCLPPPLPQPPLPPPAPVCQPRPPAVAEAMAAVLAEAASLCQRHSSRRCRKKPVMPPPPPKGHTTMTGTQMTAVSGSLGGYRLITVRDAAAAAAALGASFAGDSFMLQPTRGAIAQMSVNVTQPSEVAASSNIIGKASGDQYRFSQHRQCLAKPGEQQEYGAHAAFGGSAVCVRRLDGDDATRVSKSF